MINYLASFTNTDLAAFPDTAAVNASGPSATDGTEFVKLMIDDIWGRNQATMNYAGLVPDGVTEADGTAQMIEVLQKGFGAPPGAIIEWANAVDPAVSGHRAILLQGQGVLIASFPDLDAAVYVGDGNNAAVHAGGGKFYRASDSAGTTPNIAGPYLILPDARGVTTRGLDVAAAIDPDGASRFLGDIQSDLSNIPPHSHFNGVGTIGVGAFIYGTTVTDVPGSATRSFNDVASVPTLQGITSTSVVGGGVETRMFNRSTNFVIWY
jgi:hypothetical protein